MIIFLSKYTKTYPPSQINAAFPKTDCEKKHSYSDMWPLHNRIFGLSPGFEITSVYEQHKKATLTVLWSHLVNETLTTFPTLKLGFPKCIWKQHNFDTVSHGLFTISLVNIFSRTLSWNKTGFVFSPVEHTHWKISHRRIKLHICKWHRAMQEAWTWHGQKFYSKNPYFISIARTHPCDNTHLV